MALRARASTEFTPIVVGGKHGQIDAQVASVFCTLQAAAVCGRSLIVLTIATAGVQSVGSAIVVHYLDSHWLVYFVYILNFLVAYDLKVNCASLIC